MEPRIRVRRAQVRKQVGRRRLRLVVAVLIGLVVAALGWAATRSALLDVDHIVVEGGPLTGAPTAIEAGRVTRGTAMVDIDEGAVAKRLDTLPWVRSATVRKEWPGTLRIRLVERTPIAAAPDAAGGWALVDLGGRVLTWLTTPPPAGMVVVAGLAPAGVPGTTLAAPARGPLDVVQALPPEMRPTVVNVTVDANGINLGLAPRGTILLGDGQDVAAKLRTAELVLSGVDTTNLAVLDVRLPTTPTVTRVHP
jgi:cell division protein FtsQ